jgi:hypothetical protein
VGPSNQAHGEQVPPSQRRIQQPLQGVRHSLALETRQLNAPGSAVVIVAARSGGIAGHPPSAGYQLVWSTEVGDCPSALGYVVLDCPMFSKCWLILLPSD